VITLRIPRIETARLRLREFVEGDIETMVKIAEDPEVSRFITLDGLPKDREHAWRTMTNLMGHWALRGYGMWAVEEKASGRFAGYAGPYFPETWPDKEIGWTIAKEFWGRGFATEAARMALEYARDTLKWPKVIHVIHPENWRSIAVAERIGSKRVGAWIRGGKQLHLYGQDLGS
jgi:RimJ/RimL family protein N-acetyltransferase